MKKTSDIILFAKDEREKLLLFNQIKLKKPLDILFQNLMEKEEEVYY
jgi:hypothetical protein